MLRLWVFIQEKLHLVLIMGIVVGVMNVGPVPECSGDITYSIFWE